MSAAVQTSPAIPSTDVGLPKPRIIDAIPIIPSSLTPKQLIGMNVEQLIRNRGYPYEEYKVETEDGFILTVHRIPNPKAFTNTKSGAGTKVVMLQHGLLCSAADWVMDDPGSALAFILSDVGYDVWLGNVRGNVYSRAHKIYKDTDEKFWDWSFEDMGKYDLPAMVNFIIKQTQALNLFYVGHSQGTMIAFAGFSENQDLCRKVKTFYALAPVSYLGHVRSLIRNFATQTKNPDFLIPLLGGIGEFMPSSDFLKKMASDSIGNESLSTNMMFLLVGPNSTNIRESMVPVYAAHDPAGTSTKNIVHFAQLVLSNRFAKYDEGDLDKNLKKYGTAFPPDFPLEKITVPTVLMSGAEDWLATPNDVSQLIPRLNKDVIKASYHLDNYNHIDFLWGVDAPARLYSFILKDMQSTN